MLEPIEKIGSIETELTLDSIQLKRLRWTFKIEIRTTLPRSHRTYELELSLNEQPYLDRISELKASFDNSLFATEKMMRKDNNKRVQQLFYLKRRKRNVQKQRIAELEQKLEGLRKETEVIKFNSNVEELKYKDGRTVLVMTMPDDIVEAFNRQKTRFDIYKIALNPISY